MLIGLVIFCILNTYSASEGQPVPQMASPSIDIKAAIMSKTILVSVEYQSGSMVVLKADEDTLLNINGTLAPFWLSIDVVKHYGYRLNDITTSGLGSQGNPTRFYAIMTKP